MDLILLIAATFGVLFLLDKGLMKLLRSKAQHRSGNAVRLKKSMGTSCITLMVFSVAIVIFGVLQDQPVLTIGGSIIGPCSALLGIYYMTHGITYDEETFCYTNFGRSGSAYRYTDITGQKLYALQGGSLLAELYMADGKTVPVQTDMEGAYDFLNKASRARLRQLGQREQDCPWFDPAKACWFPEEEE